MSRLVLALLLSFLVVVSSPDADADAGIGITMGKIQVDEELKPGGRYALPAVGVINTGDRQQQYRVLISYLEEGGTLRPPQRWVELDPSRFVLDAGKTQTVGVTITLPAGAEPGHYFALIEAQMVNEGDQSLQAGVATKLTFSVAESGWLEATRRQINNLIDDTMPWSFLLPGLALAAVVLRASQRWLRFRLPFEMR